MTGHGKIPIDRLTRPILALVTCAVLGVTGISAARAEHPIAPGLHNEPVSEYLVKAAFLYNFARFAEWPSEAFKGPSDSVHLCVLGRDPFGAFLDSMKGKKIGDRRIRVRHLMWADEVEQCHLLFLSRSTKGRLARLFELLDGKPVLTVSDWPAPVRSGSVIGLEIINRKVRFRINVDAAKQSGVKLSSRLLELALIVRNGQKTTADEGAGRETSKP